MLTKDQMKQRVCDTIAAQSDRNHVIDNEFDALFVGRPPAIKALEVIPA